LPRLNFTTEINASAEDLFDFVSDPRNLASVYPKELDTKLESFQEQIKKGSQFCFTTKILNQKFLWCSQITEFRRPFYFTDIALVSPFKNWTHTHRFEEREGKTIMIDDVMYDAPLGPFGNFISRKLIAEIFKYRNKAIRKKFGEKVEPIYRDITRIPLLPGTLISAIGFILSFLIPNFYHANIYLALFYGLVSWFLAWFFSHDLMHLLVGIFLGIRFREYFIGLSNIVRLGIVKGDASFLLVALGLRIDRKIKYDKSRLAIMYLAGPLGSILFPFLISYLFIVRNLYVGLVLLTISALNLVFTSYFSPKEGCIAKAVRILKPYKNSPSS
jgi:ligand-binding SRPBCC domain-containing protein